MTNTTNPARDALTTIMLAFSSLRAASTAIADFADDRSGFAPGDLRDALDTIISLGADDDITTIAESLSGIDADFAAIFCAQNELCPEHYSDPENCSDDH